MLPERSANLLLRLVLCLSLVAATEGFAQRADAPPHSGQAPVAETVQPPLVPAEPPAQPPPQGEVFPREQKEAPRSTAKFAGRLLLQPPAGLLFGGVGAAASLIPVYAISVLICEGSIFGSTHSTCFETLFTSGVGLATSIGAGVGVVAVGYLLDGRARVGATIAGALVGSVVGGVIALSTGKESVDLAPFLWVGPVLGATLVYALSDAFFPDPTRIIVPDEKEEEDEYARVLPMISTTRTGGIIGGIVGRF
jgi:hypothetical protein